jgi:Site-specific recombinase XerD
MSIRDGWLNFKPGKTSKTTGVKLDIPVLPPLAQSIEAYGEKEHLAFLMTEHGKPFTANGFGNYFKDCCRAAGLGHCTAHGLRKAGATFAAENGATTKQLMAMYGWSSVKMAEHYTRQADQKRLAGTGMHLISVEQNMEKQCPTSEALDKSVGQKRQKTQ